MLALMIYSSPLRKMKDEVMDEFVGRIPNGVFAVENMISTEQITRARGHHSSAWQSG